MNKVAVFASGRGSNFKQLCIAHKNKKFDAKIALLIASKADIGAIEIAREYDIPFEVFISKNYTRKEEYDNALLACLNNYSINYIALAGWMKLIPSSIVKAFENRMLNIHPALLPFFGGKGMYGSHVHQAVWESGMLISGATVHIVDEEYDRGMIIKQECVPLDFDDTPESIAHKVLKVEHKIYPQALKMLVENEIDFNIKKRKN